MMRRNNKGSRDEWQEQAEVAQKKKKKKNTHYKMSDNQISEASCVSKNAMCLANLDYQ